MNSKGKPLIANYNQKKIIDENSLNTLKILSNWQDKGYFVETNDYDSIVISQNAIFNVISDYEDAIYHYESFEQNELGVVPFPSSDSDYHTALIKTNCYTIPQVNEYSISSEMLESILYDLIDGYNNDDYYVESKILDNELNKKVFESTNNLSIVDLTTTLCVHLNKSGFAYQHDCIQFVLIDYLVNKNDRFSYFENNCLKEIKKLLKE